jgi:nucleoside-diphosphate-sugar epimerase
MKLLVTGAAGFVGSHAVRAALARGWDVYGLVRQSSHLQRLTDIHDAIQLVRCDLDDWTGLAAALEEAPIEACLHCAWFAEPGRYLAAPENIASLMNTLKLMQLVAASGCKRFVGVGSCFEYSPRIGYFSEDTPTETTSLYAAAKTSAGIVLGPMGAALGVKTTWARLFFQYGPHEDARRLVPSVVRSLLAGQPVRTTLGEQIRDFLHIGDVASALVEVTAADMPGVVNIGSGRPVTVRKVVETIARHLQRPELVELGALPYRPGDPMFICANNARLMAETTWRPVFTLSSGLIDTIEWWRIHG